MAPRLSIETTTGYAMTQRVDTKREAPAEPAVSKEEILSRVRALGPMIRERARATEELGMLHPDVKAALEEAGVFRVPTPARFGGLGLEWDTVSELSVELGRYCGAAAWCQSVWAIHTWWIGQCPIETQEEYFSTGPDTLSSSSFGLGGGIESAVARQVDGGFRVTGHWKYSSGCDHSEWAMLGVLESSFGGVPPSIDPNLPVVAPEGTWLALIHRNDFQIVDNWDVSGLRGTGSKDVIVEDAFVPTRRMIKLPQPHGEDSIGWQLHRRLSHLLPGNGTWFTLQAAVFGMCQGIVDEFARDSSREGSTPIVQAALGESAAEVDSVLLLMRRDVQEGLDKAARGEALTELEHLRVARDTQYGVRACLRAAARLNEWSGAHTVQRSHPIQRLIRDANAGAKRARSGLQRYGLQLISSSAEWTGSAEAKKRESEEHVVA